jgi:Zn-dependent peptidase ImmA (M78 family)
MSDHISYNSEFLPSITIFVVFSDDPQYEQLKPLFEEYGYGFMVPNKNMILIDGEILLENGNTEDLLKFIEAHEIAHVILNHDGPRDEDEELDADLGAYLLLSRNNNIKAIKPLLKHFKERHGIKFDEKLLDRVKKHFPG